MLLQDNIMAIPVLLTTSYTRSGQPETNGGFRDEKQLVDFGIKPVARR